MVRNVLIIVFLIGLVSTSQAQIPSKNAVQLHLDKTVYYAGETVRVKGYVLSKALANQDVLLTFSDISQKKVLREMRLKSSQLTKGFIIDLDNELKSAVYQIALFNESYQLQYNSTSFLIINPSDQADLISENRVDDMTIYVEGSGDIISGTENTLVVDYRNNQLTDQYFAILTDQLDSIIQKAQIKGSGLAKIEFIPENGKSYKVKVTNNERLVANKTLSTPISAGIVLRTTHSSQKDILLDALFIGISHQGHKLEVVSRENIIASFDIDNGEFKRQFLSNSLPEGIIQFRVLDKNGQVIKNRLIFNHSYEKLKLMASTEKSSYKPGETVRLNIKSANKNGASVPVNASISISDANQVKDFVTYKQNIWAEDFSQLDRIVDNLSNYFDPLLIKKWVLDDLMITLDTYKTTFKKLDSPLIVQTGIHVSGRVIPKESNVIPKGIILTIPELNGLIRYANTDQGGNFLFDGFDFEGTHTVYLGVWPPSSGEDYNWVINQQEPPAINSAASIPELNSEQLKKVAKYNDIRLRVDNQYKNKSEETEELNADRKSVNGLLNVDRKIEMNDYINLPDMKTVIKEVVPYAQAKKKGFKIFSPELRKTFPGKPLVLLDGIPVNDTTILNLDPILIEKIELINTFKNIYKIGKVAENGIISFYTRPGHNIENTGATQLDLKGYYKPKAKTQLNQESNIPRLPAVIYWNGHIGISTDGQSYIEFQAPDYATTLNVHIEGMSSDNSFGISETKIEITY